MSITPVKDQERYEAGNDRSEKYERRRTSKPISNNGVQTRIKGITGGTEKEVDKSAKIRELMPDEIKNTEVLDYSGQLWYFAKRYWYITMLILVILALWILFWVEISIAILNIKWYLFIPVAMIGLTVSLLGLYVVFIKTLDEIPKNNNAVLLIKGKPQSNVVAAEGWAFTIRLKKLIAWDVVSIEPVPWDKEIANVITGSGASIKKIGYGFVLAAIPKALLALRGRGGMGPVVDSFDNSVELAIRQVVGRTPLGATQRLPDSLLIEITVVVLDKLAPITWSVHNNKDKGNMSLVSPDDPMFLYKLGVSINILRVSNAEVSDELLKVQNKIAEEGYERISDLENTVTRVMEVGRYIEGLQAFGGDPNPESVGDMMQEAENLKNGAITFTGLSKLLGSLAKNIKLKDKDQDQEKGKERERDKDKKKVDIGKAIKEIRTRSNKEREELLDEAQNRLGSKNEKK